MPIKKKKMGPHKLRKTITQTQTRTQPQNKTKIKGPQKIFSYTKGTAATSETKIASQPD